MSRGEIQGRPNPRRFSVGILPVKSDGRASPLLAGVKRLAGGLFYPEVAGIMDRGSSRPSQVGPA
jgi:hypothetical protein